MCVSKIRKKRDKKNDMVGTSNLPNNKIILFLQVLKEIKDSEFIGKQDKNHPILPPFNS